MKPLDYLHRQREYSRQQLAHRGRALLGDLPSRDELGAAIRHRSPGILVGGVLAGLLGTLMVRGRSATLKRAGALLVGLAGRQAVRTAGRHLASAMLAERRAAQSGALSSPTQRR